jgi:murein DD-endopeptidase MepM/ murein hydrolase activator NlpD
MKDVEESVGSFEDSLVMAVIIAAILIALFFGLTAVLITVSVILVLGPGILVVIKMLSFIKNIASGTGKFLIRVSNFVFSKPIATTNGSGWGMNQASDAAEKLPLGTVGTAGFTAGGNIVGDPTLEAVNATTVSAQVHIGEVGRVANYTASFPLGDPFQGPSYLLFGPLDQVKYTPFWLPVVEAAEQTNTAEEQKYLKLCPYSNPLYKEPNGLAGNSYTNPLVVRYDNSKNTPQYNYYGYVDSNENDGAGSSFGAISNGSFALDDTRDGNIGVDTSKTPDVANAGALRLSSNNAVWIKDMRTQEIRLVPFQTLNGELRTSMAETSLKYEYIETTKTSGQSQVMDSYGNPRMATTNVIDPKTGEELATRLYPVTSEWTVTTGGRAEVSAVLNLGFGLSPIEGYVLAKRTGLLINQDKIYAVPQLAGNFAVSGGYASAIDTSKAKNFSYYHESPGAGIVIFNLRSTGSDTLTLEADKDAYYAQENTMSYVPGDAESMDQFKAWKGTAAGTKAYNDFWINIDKSDAAKPDFLIKETNEQFLVSMEYKPFTGDMIKYWAEKMPGFTPAHAEGMGTVAFTKDAGGWGVQNVVGEDGSILSKVFVPVLTTVTLPSGTTSSFLSKDTPADSTTPADFKNLYYNPAYYSAKDGIDSQGFNSKLGVKGEPNSAADSTHASILNTGKIYADPFKSMPESFISRFSNFNPFTAFANKITANTANSTPLFAFESGVKTFVGVSSAEYTQFANYKTTGPQAGYVNSTTGQMVPIMRIAGDPITDLSTGKPATEVVTVPAIKLPWGPNPISSAEVVLPFNNEELSKYTVNGSKLGGAATTFYQKIAGLTNDGTENLSYLPLMDKTKLQNAQDRAVYPLYAEGTKFYLSEFVKDVSSGSWRFNRDFVEPSQAKTSSNYKYIVTPKLPDDFAIFTKYISYSEGVDFNKTALDASGATTGSTVTNAIKPASTSYESDFSYEVDPATGLAKDINKNDDLLASLYKIKQGDMNADGTLTTEALNKIEDPSKQNYISASKVGTFAIVNPSDYYQAPQEIILDVTQDNIVNIKVPSEGEAVMAGTSIITPPSESYLSVFKGFPQGSPLGSYNTCVTGAFGISGDYTAATGASFHAGIDLSTGGGSQPIYSTLNGVIRLGSTENGGNVIEIWSTYTGADGKEYFVRVRFCHTASSVVSDGDQVKPGDLVGYSGNSGTPFGGMGVSSYAYHLHYEIRIASVYADLMNSTKSAKNPLAPEFGISSMRIGY